MASFYEEEAELANWDPRREDYYHPKSLIIGGDGPAANFVRKDNLARAKEVVQERPGIYVRNVPLTWNDNGLRNLFSEYGTVLSAYVGTPNKDSKTTFRNTWGIVKVANKSDVVHMIQALSNKPPHYLRVEVAMTTEERDRRRKQKAEEAQHNQEMQKLVESFDTSTIGPPKKSGFGRGRINLSGSDEGSPRRPGSLSIFAESSNISQEKTMDCSKTIPQKVNSHSGINSPVEVHQLTKPLDTSKTAESETVRCSPSEVTKPNIEQVTEQYSSISTVNHIIEKQSSSQAECSGVKESSDAMEPSYEKQGNIATVLSCNKQGSNMKLAAAVPNKQQQQQEKVMVEMSLGSVAVGYRKPRPCINVMCNEGGKYRCSICKAWYCSKICQVDDWYSHQDHCQPPPSLEIADPAIYNIDSEGKNNPLDVQHLINSSSTNLSSQNTPTYKFQDNVKNNVLSTQEEKEITVSNSAQCQSTIMDDKHSFKENLVFKNNRNTIKETYNSSFDIKSTSEVTKDIKENNLYSLNDGSEDNAQNIFNKVSLGAQENNSIDEPDFMRVSTKIDQEYEPVVSGRNGGFDSSTKFKSNSVDGMSSEKEILLKEPTNQHTAEKIKTITDKETQGVKSDLITKGSSPSLSKSSSEVVISAKATLAKFPSLSDEMKVEQNYSGLITDVDNYNHFTISIFSFAQTILAEGNELIAKAPNIPDFEVTFGTLVGAFSEQEQAWFRAYVMDQFEDGQTKVFFIDFGNIEVVQMTKPLPDGIMKDTAGLAVIATRYKHCIIVSETEKLESIIQVDNVIKIKLDGIKKTSMLVSLLNEDGDTLGTYILRPWYTALDTSSLLSRAPSNDNVKSEIYSDKSSNSNSTSLVPTQVLKAQFKQESKINTHTFTGDSDESKKLTSEIQQQGKSPQHEISTNERQSTGARPKEKCTPSQSQEISHEGGNVSGKPAVKDNKASLVQNMSTRRIAIPRRLTKISGNANSIPMGEEQFWASRLSCEKLEVGKLYEVMPVWCSEDNCLWVQVNTKENVSASKKMQEHMVEIERVETAPTAKDLSPGELVSAKVKKDDRWYRCEIKEIEKDKVKVFYVDFGDCSTLALENIRKTSKDIADIQQLGVKLNLIDINMNDVAVKQKIMDCIDSEVCIKIRIEADNPVVASIHDSKIDLNKDLNEEIKENQVKESNSDFGSSFNESSSPEELQNIPGPTNTSITRNITIVEPSKVLSPSSEKTTLTSTPPCTEAMDSPLGTKGSKMDEAIGRLNNLPRYEDIEAVKLPVGEETTVLVMTNENPHTIMVIPADPELFKHLDELQEKINSHCKALPNRLYRPVTSEVCLARFEEDGTWYRAACIAQDVNRSFVIFADYGNVASVANEEIRQMDPKFLPPIGPPLMALHCVMQGVDPEMPDALKPNCFEAFKQLLPAEQTAVMSILSHDVDGTYIVNIPHVLEALQKKGLID